LDDLVLAIPIAPGLPRSIGVNYTFLRFLVRARRRRRADSQNDIRDLRAQEFAENIPELKPLTWYWYDRTKGEVVAIGESATRHAIVILGEELNSVFTESALVSLAGPGHIDNVAQQWRELAENAEWLAATQSRSR
jgi:hypothetical protein